MLEEDEELDEMSNAKPARRPRRPRIQNKPPGFEDMLNVGDEEAASAHAKSSKPVAIKQRRGTDAAGNKIMPAGSKPPVRPPPAKAPSAKTDTASLAAATSLEQYGQIYKQLAKQTGKPDQWAAIMAELGAGKNPTEVATAISRFGDQSSAHKLKFVELAKPVAIKQRRGTDAAGNKIMPAGSKPPARPPPAKAAPKTPAPATAPSASPPAAKSSSGPKVNLGGKGGVRWQLAQAGVRGSQLSQIVKAIQDWAKSSNLEINEGQLLKDLSDELITESRFNRWRQIAGLLRS